MSPWPPRDSREWLARFFLWLVLVQSFHFLEHCVQLVQRYIFNDPNGNGLLGNLAGFEQLHFGYNSLFLIGLLCVYTNVSLASRPVWWRPRLVARLLAAAVAIQGYHEVEHALRMLQVLGWMHASAAPAGPLSSEPPGFLGQWFNGALLHWALNGVVDVLPAAAFVFGGFQWQLNTTRNSKTSQFAAPASVAPQS